MISHLRWAPHFLAAEDKRIWVDMAGELLRVLAGQVTHQWHGVVSLGKSWVYLSAEQEMTWVSPGETVPDKERQMTWSPKLMLTVVWNRGRLHIAKSLPKGTKFNTRYCVNNIRIRISDGR
jgi:hypothetical protein